MILPCIIHKRTHTRNAQLHTYQQIKIPIETLKLTYTVNAQLTNQKTLYYSKKKSEHGE
jgi:hypothetical protein